MVYWNIGIIYLITLKHDAHMSSRISNSLVAKIQLPEIKSRLKLFALAGNQTRALWIPTKTESGTEMKWHLLPQQWEC